jgi:hypothetical protein
MEVENAEIFTNYLNKDGDEGIPSLAQFGEKVHRDSIVSTSNLNLYSCVSC